MGGRLTLARKMEAAFLAVVMVAAGGVLLVLLDTVPQLLVDGPVHLRLSALGGAFTALTLMFAGAFRRMPARRV